MCLQDCRCLWSVEGVRALEPFTGASELLRVGAGHESRALCMAGHAPNH